MKHEVNFHDKDTQFYRFRDSESSLSPVANERESEEELQEGLSLLSQLGPDALLTMILRKWSVRRAEELRVLFLSFSLSLSLNSADVVPQCRQFVQFVVQLVPVCSPSQRSAEDLEVIYEELLHVKAAAHLSTSVSHSTVDINIIATSRGFSFDFSIWD